MKRFGIIIVLLAAIVSMIGCNHRSDKGATASNVIRIGTIAGPETELMEVAKHVAAERYNLDVEIIEFTDYVLPNQALADGDIDANMFQHEPYLKETIAAKGYKLTPIGKTFVYPMALYSKKIKNLNALPLNAVVAIPNDPSNEARALLLLERSGLIKIKPGVGLKATPQNIIENEKHLQFKELDAAQLPRLLPDVDLAAINTNYALVAGLLPSKDGLFLEGPDSPYANIVVVRTDDKDNPKYVKLMDALHSQQVVSKAQTLFQGQAIPAWK